MVNMYVQIVRYVLVDQLEVLEHPCNILWYLSKVWNPDHNKFVVDLTICHLLLFSWLIIAGKVNLSLYNEKSFIL